MGNTRNYQGSIFFTSQILIFAVAALAVSTCHHYLPNKIVLLASFDLTLSNQASGSPAGAHSAPVEEVEPRTGPKGNNHRSIFIDDNAIDPGEILCASIMPTTFIPNLY